MTGTKPHFDASDRSLWLGKILVKRFRVPAANQELILLSFQEQGWVACIDDPLPPAPGVDPKRRLHDAINRLNRNQLRPVLRFSGNGKGTGVSWSVRRKNRERRY